MISIHAPREGGDYDSQIFGRLELPISIHAPREGGDQSLGGVFVNLSISIHAPREGGDVEGKARATERLISIHAPREGGDCGFLKSPVYSLIFQSTPPARGATSRQFIKQADYFTFQSTPPARGATLFYCPIYGTAINFNPRPPRGGRPGRHRAASPGRWISIHAPREGGDPPGG